METSTPSQRELEPLAHKYGIRLLLLFGSTISGHLHPNSDIDLGLLFRDTPPDFRTRCSLHQDLQRHFPEREVDLAVLNHADPLFLKKVTENCRLLYGNPTEFYSLRMFAFRRYQDHRPFLAMEHRFIRKFLNRFPQSA